MRKEGAERCKRQKQAGPTRTVADNRTRSVRQQEGENVAYSPAGPFSQDPRETGRHGPLETLHTHTHTVEHDHLWVSLKDINASGHRRPAPLHNTIKQARASITAAVAIVIVILRLPTTALPEFWRVVRCHLHPWTQVAVQVQSGQVLRTHDLINTAEVIE